VKLACDGVLPADCLVAVYDFGGGTFDTTLVQRDGDRFSVIGDPAGLGDFGGIDIDDLVLDHVDRSLDGAIARLDMSDPASITALTRLRAECRDAKERLSYDTEVTIDASLPHLPALVQLTRAEFEDIIRPRLETTIDVMLDMLDRAGFRPSEVDAVALVGGSSRIPAVVDLLAARTTMQVLVDPYPELTVALGAAQMVDDEVSSSSVFPLADMALPSLGSLGAAGAAGVGAGAGAVGAGATGLMEPTTGPVGPFGPPGGSGMGHNVGTAVDPPPGAHLGAAAGGYDETSVEAFDMFGRPDPAYGGPDRGGRPPMSVEEEAFGAGLDEGSGSRLSDRLGGGLNPQKGLVVLACFLTVLLFGGIIVALTSGGGDDDPSTTVPDSSLVDETAGTVTDPDTSTSSTPSSSSSSSSTSTTAADGEDDDDPATPPAVDPPTTDDDGGPSSPGTSPTTRPSTPTTRPSTPTTRPAPTTTSTTTTSTTTTTTTTTTDPPTPPAGDSMAPALREDPPTE
jgi:hypothetical protein